MYPIYCGHDLVKHWLTDGSLRLTCTKCPAVSVWHYSSIPVPSHQYLGPWIIGFSETDPNERRLVDLRDDILKKALAEQIADYVATNARYDEMGRREVIIEAVWVLTNDIGAAQKFVQAIGLNIDLYTYDFVKQRPKSRIKITNDPDGTLVDFMKNVSIIEESNG